jgi:hypothetical protein
MLRRSPIAKPLIVKATDRQAKLQLMNGRDSRAAGPVSAC